jgi:hypothetical protein
MVCKCGKKIRGADKIKIKGVWLHKHHTSIKKPAKIKSRNLEMENSKLSDDQLIKRLAEGVKLK